MRINYCIHDKKYRQHYSHKTKHKVTGQKHLCSLVNQMLCLTQMKSYYYSNHFSMPHIPKILDIISGAAIWNVKILHFLMRKDDLTGVGRLK